MEGVAGNDSADTIDGVGEQVTGGPAAPGRPPTTGIVARAVSWKALSVIVGQGLWYASLFVLAILVPPRDFGVIAVGAVIINATILVLESGTGGALIIARELDARSVRSAVLRTTSAGVVLMLAFAALAGPIANTFAKGADPWAFRALACIVGLAAAWVVPNALLKKYLSFKRIAIVTITAAAVASTAAVIAAVLGAGLWALVIRLVLQQLLLTALGWAAVASLLPRARGDDAPSARPRGATAFLLIAVAELIAWDGDTLIVGASTNTTQLGYYALAFSLAYLPLSQVSWTFGTVLFPAIAAARDPETVRRQALKALRLMAFLLMPLLPAAVVLAPSVIPGLLGHKWTGAVVPFQILVVVGVGQGLLNVLGEVFSGVGGDTVRRRSRIDLSWAVATLVAIAIGVQLGGIRGAAAAHVVTFSFLAFAYAVWGARTIGLPVGTLLAQLRGVGACVLVQALVTAAAALGLLGLGASTLAAGLAGAAAGALALALMLQSRERGLLVESRAVVSAALGRQPA
jgi:O-antigen/teichoic acid export membrane protein